MRRNSDHPHPLADAWSRHQRGEVSYAYAAYTAYLEEFPQDTTALHYLGVLAHQTGHVDKAIELLRKAIALDTTDMRVANHLGQIYADRREWAEASACFKRAAELDPKSGEPVNNLGNVMRQTGRIEEAMQLYRSAITIDSGCREGHYNLGKVLRDRRAFGDALQSFRRAVDLDATNYRFQYELALCLEELGDFVAATAHYQAALRTNPQHARSMGNLLALQPFTPDDEFITHAIKMAESEGTNSEARSKLHQGIGKYFDRASDYGRAFAHFAASNALQRARSKPAIQGAAAKRLAAAARFDAKHFSSVRELGHPTGRPLFIVGMPRSGTTLIEQVLASHPDVFGAGELMEMPRIAAAMAGPHPPSIADAAQRYLDQLEAVAPAQALHVTDKLPINYRHLGVIATLFPNVRIIRCERDPRDVTLSCFIEMFGIGDQDFTSLPGIAAAAIEEAQLMQHWHSVLPASIHEVDYSRFIADQEAETRRLLFFCGLSWNERCLRFFSTARSVDTPSRWQVRQPIYTSSAGRWRNYASQLQPAITILERAGLLVGDMT